MIKRRARWSDVAFIAVVIIATVLLPSRSLAPRLLFSPRGLKSAPVCLRTLRQIYGYSETCPLRDRSPLRTPLEMAASPDTTTTAALSMSLPDFIRERGERPTQHVVIGNPAGDADSILSAIALAYVESVLFAKDKSAQLLTPVVSIPRSDLTSQRPETTLLLNLAGITPSLQNQLLFVDDERVRTMSNLSITLVDHNHLEVATDHQLFPNSQVVAIWDHHFDQGHHTDTCRERHIAFDDHHALVASTGTLVVERLRGLLQQDAVTTTTTPADLSLLLLGLILLDSVNLSEAAGKVTPRDVAAVEFLVQRTEWQQLDPSFRERFLGPAIPHPAPPQEQQQQPNTTLLFQALQGAKFDPVFWKGLSVRDALRLDYKEFSASHLVPPFGMSTVLLSMEDFVEKSEWVQGVDAFMKQVRVDLLVVSLSFTTEKNGILQRQMILCGRSESLVSGVVDYLKSADHAQDSLLVSDVVLPATATFHNLTLRGLNQGNSKASRKQVAPILLHYFEKKASKI